MVLPQSCARVDLERKLSERRRADASLALHDPPETAVPEVAANAERVRAGLAPLDLVRDDRVPIRLDNLFDMRRHSLDPDAVFPDLAKLVRARGVAPWGGVPKGLPRVAGARIS